MKVNKVERLPVIVRAWLINFVWCIVRVMNFFVMYNALNSLALCSLVRTHLLLSLSSVLFLISEKAIDNASFITRFKLYVTVLCHVFRFRNI